MKPLLTLFALFLIGNQLNAADSTSTWNDVIRTFRKSEVSTAVIKPSLAKKTLQHIEVLDVRSDTSRIGMFSDFKYRPTEIVFDKSGSLADVMETKLSDQTSNGLSVLMVVQDFWLNEIKAEIVADKNSQTKPAIHTSKIVCKVDVFIKQENSYYPLTRVDTVLWDKKGVVASSKNLLASALTIINNKIEIAANTNNFLNHKRTSREEIYTAYQRRFLFPAFCSECPKKGLYTSLDEFKNNHPYATNFVVKTHSKEPPSLFIVDGNGNETITRNVWGVSDGKNMYIMQKGMLFKLYKNANAFYWMGVKYFDLRMYETAPSARLGVGGEPGMDEPVASNVKIRLTPYLLHPETGEGY